MHNFVCFLAVCTVACAQIGIFSGAYSDAACTSYFLGTKAGVLPSGYCADSNGTSVKVIDKGTTYDGGFSCTATTCASCLLNCNQCPYGKCYLSITGIYFQAFKVVEGTVLYLAVFNSITCSTAIANFEKYLSVSFPTSCKSLHSVALSGTINIFNLGDQVALQTGCSSTFPCGSCAYSVIGAYNTCMITADANGNLAYVKIWQVAPSA